VEIVALLARCAERDEQITVLRMKLEGGGGGRTVIDGSPKGGRGGRAEDVPRGSTEDVDDDDYSVLSFQCRTVRCSKHVINKQKNKLTKQRTLMINY